MDANAIPYEFIIADADFNLAKSRRKGKNVIGQRVIIDVPDQRGENITMRMPSPIRIIVSSTVMPTLDHATQPVLSHFWTDSTNFSNHKSILMIQTRKEMDML